MKEIIILVTFVCWLHIERTDAVTSNSNIPRDSSSLICSQYKTDYDIIQTFPFPVTFNPVKSTNRITYILTRNSTDVYYVHINNQGVLPQSIFCLSNLQQLHIRHAKFSNFNNRIPSEIENLASTLAVLAIYSTNVTHVAEQISKCNKLQILVLQNTSLMALPESIGNLSLLNTLYVAHNNIKSLPESMSYLESLTDFGIENNPSLTSLNQLSGLPNLTTVQASRCSIECIPNNIPKLEDFYITKNKLSNLFGVHTLGYESNGVKHFYFNDNKIRIVSPEIRNVRDLFWLNLDSNSLVDLPYDLFDIPTLHYLYIRNNKFSSEVLDRIIEKCTINQKIELHYLNNTRGKNCSVFKHERLLVRVRR